MGHKQLTLEQRYHIYGLWRSGYLQKDIAKEVGVHKSTISRELKRNMFWWNSRVPQYNPGHAQAFCKDRHKMKRKRVTFTEAIQLFICEKLQQDWSPEQISGYAKRHQLFLISHERIYQFILADKEKGGSLYLHLRHQHKKYRKRYGSYETRGALKNRVFIDDRPQIVDEKTRIGDWEIDTIIGQNRQQAVVTMVERVSKKTVCKKIPSRKAELTKDAIVAGLKPFGDFVLTITADNGFEFAAHETIGKELKADFYFAHPYSSWERGLNENTNGLIRQYLKKGCDFSEVTDESLRVIMDKLNNRPRKSLGYATPNEVLNI